MPKVLGLEIDLEKPDRDLFCITAHEIARGFNLVGGGENGRLNTRTQMRGFYDEIVSWNDKIGIDETKYIDNEALLRMFLAKVAYSKGRGHITQEVQEFMNESFKQIKNAKTLDNFRLLFEAIMGYYAGYRSK